MFNYIFIIEMYSIVIGRLEERLSHLRGDVEELRIKQEELEHEYQKSMEVWKFSEKIESNHTTNKNYELKSRVAMEVLEKRISLLRSQIDIIRRISPEIADDLEDKINHVDKSRLDSVRLLDEHFSRINSNQFRIDNQDDLKRLQKIDEYGYLTEELGSRIDDVISTASRCLISTLEYFDNEK